MRKVLKSLFGWTAPLFYRLPRLFHLYHTNLAKLAAQKYGFPGKELTVIGVTGTNGKTTVCVLIHSILKAAGLKVGLITTVKTVIGNQEEINESKLTSLPPETTQRLLRKMLEKGDRYAVLEVSSIALDQDRFWGVPFDVAVFTNLTHDHLDYHRTMENYRLAKGKLFKLLNSFSKGVPKTSVVNLDDPSGAYFWQFPADQRIGFGLNAPEKKVSAEVLQASASRYLLTLEEEGIEVQPRLRGLFNLYNALAAAAAAWALKIPLAAIKEGLEAVALVPGRMEEVEAGQPFRVVVDYAHTPDGFEKALGTLRQATGGRLIVLFGAAGNRDAGKRPALGKIASQFADLMILTEEDPAQEDPLKIIEQIRQGVGPKFTENQNLWIVPSRKEALKQAFSLARAGDLVALLGLGAQTTQTLKAGKVSYHEPTVAKELLQH